MGKVEQGIAIFHYTPLYFILLSYECAQSLSRVRLFATPWTVACQAPLSMEFSKQEYWSGLPFPSPGYLPNPGIKPASLCLLYSQANSLPLCHLEHTWQKHGKWKTSLALSLQSFLPPVAFTTSPQWRTHSELTGQLYNSIRLNIFVAWSLHVGHGEYGGGQEKNVVLLL